MQMPVFRSQTPLFSYKLNSTTFYKLEHDLRTSIIQIPCPFYFHLWSEEEKNFSDFMHLRVDAPRPRSEVGDFNLSHLRFCHHSTSAGAQPAKISRFFWIFPLIISSSRSSVYPKGSSILSAERSRCS
jgi:hypothetical protein